MTDLLEHVIYYRLRSSLIFLFPGLFYSLYHGQFYWELDNIDHFNSERNNIIEPSVNPTSRNMPLGHNPILIVRVKQFIYKAVPRMKQAEELASLAF